MTVNADSDHLHSLLSHSITDGRHGSLQFPMQVVMQSVHTDYINNVHVRPTEC